MIALEMTWVVETGMPKWAVVNRIEAAVVSAAKPWTGSSLATRWPIVRMIRQPPTAVPADSAVAETTMTQVGTVTLGITPAENRARVMMPIVFCASFEPWAKAMNAAENDLQPAEAAGHRLALRPPEDPEDREDEGERDREAEDRRGEHRDEDLADDPRQVQRAGPGADDRRAEQAADQRVAARARQALLPGDEVPRDRADERRRDDRLGRGRIVDQAARRWSSPRRSRRTRR